MKKIESQTPYTSEGIFRKKYKRPIPKLRIHMRDKNPKQKKKEEQIMFQMRVYLAQAREKKNLTMRDVAETLQVDFHYYYRIEIGEIKRINFLTFSKIGHLLDIPLETLYSLEEAYLEK